MNERTDIARLAECFAALDEDAVHRIIDGCLVRTVDPSRIVTELTRGMEEIGRLYKTDEYALAEIIYSGEIFKQAVAKVKPFMSADLTTHRGCLVIGTVQGDIHDLGKNIVTMLLECAGFEVIDLGVNVPPETFVDAARHSGARLVGMSLLLTTAMDAMRETIQAIERAGFRDRVKIVIGGAPTSERLKDEIGADFYGRDAVEAVAIARQVYADMAGEGAVQP